MRLLTAYAIQPPRKASLLQNYFLTSHGVHILTVYSRQSPRGFLFYWITSWLSMLSNHQLTVYTTQPASGWTWHPPPPDYRNRRLNVGTVLLNPLLTGNGILLLTRNDSQAPPECLCHSTTWSWLALTFTSWLPLIFNHHMGVSATQSHPDCLTYSTTG